MEKRTFLSLLCHFVVFIACTYPSSSILLNDRSFEISNLPSSRAEKLIRELNLFPKLDVNVIDVGDSPLASSEEVPSIVERSFRFPNIVSHSDDGASVEDLGHRAGYYKLPKSQGARMFYFFFESRKKKKDAPVVIWLTGGPGCSSELAMFYENGPFKIDKNMSLVWNEYGWDQVSNLLYVDQPVGTGFSYTTDKSDIRHDEKGVSDDLYDFLQAFFAEHPKLTDNDFYITGESYAGHYIPAFAARGFAIGNGLTNPALQYPAYPDYALEMGLITQSEHDRLKKIVPLCELSIKLCGTDGTVSCLASYLVCNTLFSGVINHAGGVNYYDIRKKCEGSLCYDFSDMEKFLNLQSVRKSLGVGDIEFVSCSTSVYQAMLQDWMRNLEVGIPTLLEDGINLLVYAGEYDLICNWLGNSRWVNAMEWSGQENFKATNEVPFVVDGKEAGKLKSYGQLSFLKVHDAGHMVPMDQPEAALKMLKRWMENSLSGGDDDDVATTITEGDDLVAQITGQSCLCLVIQTILSIHQPLSDSSSFNIHQPPSSASPQLHCPPPKPNSPPPPSAIPVCSAEVVSPRRRDELARIDESWAVARFDSLPHVVHILTSKDRETDVLLLKEQSDVVEEVVDEVVHAYHGGFNKAIQNYSQILRLFSESTEKLGDLKHDLADAKRSLGTRNKQLHQLWYRSVTLRHIIALLDQIEGIAKVPSRIEKLIADKQFYAAIQVYLQSSLMLEREGLQTVGALQDVRSELTKLRGALFFKILDDLHAHLYNRGEYSSVASSIYERDDDVPTTTAVAASRMSSQPLSRRTRTLKGDSQFVVRGLTNGSHRTSSIEEGSSFDGHDEEDSVEHDEATDSKLLSHQLTPWLSDSTPDEFIEAVRKSDDPLHVKYLQTLVQCLCMLGKVAAAGAIICQKLRPTIHEIIISKIKAHMETRNLSKSACSQGDQTVAAGLHFIKGQPEAYRLSKEKPQNRISNSGTHLAVSPVSPLMVPGGKAQAAAKDLLDSILDTIVKIFENHVVIGELLELKASQHDINTPKSLPTNVNWNTDSEASQVTGGYTISYPLTVLQSECQQLICEILRATPEAASADAVAQTAKVAKKASKKDKRQDCRNAPEDGLTFTFRFTDATVSISNQGADLIRQGWGKKAPNSSQEGYGSAAVLPEQGIYLAASIYRPVLQFTDKITSMLPKKHSQLVIDGLLTFTENFVKDHLLPTMFVDYRKGVQQAISSAAAFRPRAHTTTYTPTVEKGRPILQGLLAIDLLAKEVLGWAQAMPKFSTDLVKYVQTFLERTFERCRTSYMEAVLEKLSYRLIGRHDIEKLMRLDPASACLPALLGHSVSHSEAVGSDVELCELFLSLPSIKQDSLIRDDNKLILLASLSDSLEYVADSIERLGQAVPRAASQSEDNSRNQATSPRNLASFADEYRKLATDCLKVLRVEMQLETVFHLQEMTNREYLEDEDAEEPDDFVISLTSQITRRDEGMAPFISGEKRNYVFGGICGIAATASIKALAEMRSINLFGVQQICRNTIALEQAMAAIPYVDGESVQQNLDRVRTYFELLNMPFEALLAFIAEHDQMFTPTEYSNLLKVNVPGRDTPTDAQSRLSEILSH
uniref:Exocyst complex component Sec8 n=1 Tax=Brassica campestris TaxID=3711 RepID=M4EZ67_BRACM